MTSRVISPQVLEAIAAGDQQAFAALFDHYHSKVLHVAYLLTHSEAQAKDIVQDVFMRLWMRRQQLPQIQHLDNWIFIISRNHALKALARQARAIVTGEEAADYLPSLDVSIEDRLNADSLQALIREALEPLTVQQQRVFELIKLQGLNRDEAGKQLGLSPHTVKMHLLRATKAVRAHLSRKLDYLTILLLLEHWL